MRASVDSPAGGPLGAAARAASHRSARASRLQGARRRVTSWTQAPADRNIGASRPQTRVHTMSDEDGSRGVDDWMVDAYNELRRLASAFLRNEDPSHTLQPTALVHEAFLRLRDQRAKWESHAHFLAFAAMTLRRILTDHARGKRRLKRGGGSAAVPLDDDCSAAAYTIAHLIHVDQALGELAELDSRQAKIVEMKFFGGMTNEQVAEYLGVSLRTVEGEWAMAKAWLAQRLEPDS